MFFLYKIVLFLIPACNEEKGENGNSIRKKGEDIRLAQKSIRASRHFIREDVVLR